MFPKLINLIERLLAAILLGPPCMGQYCVCHRRRIRDPAKLASGCVEEARHDDGSGYRAAAGVSTKYTQRNFTSLLREGPLLKSVHETGGMKKEVKEKGIDRGRDRQDRRYSMTNLKCTYSNGYLLPGDSFGLEDAHCGLYAPRGTKKEVSE